eukprot:2934411-Alexandrium_andersonii.AAC.1
MSVGTDIRNLDPVQHVAMVGAAAEPSSVSQNVGGCQCHGCIGQWLDALVNTVKARHSGGCRRD